MCGGPDPPGQSAEWASRWCRPVVLNRRWSALQCKPQASLGYACDLFRSVNLEGGLSNAFEQCRLSHRFYQQLLADHAADGLDFPACRVERGL